MRRYCFSSSAVQELEDGWMAKFMYPFDTLRALKRRWNAWLYLYYGPSMIQKGYDNAKGQPFEIFAPDNRYVFVSSTKHIKEVDSAPDTVLSLQAASKQILQPMYTMHGFNWFDRRGTEGVGFVRALRTLLTNNMPNILPDLRVAIARKFAKMHAESPVVNGSRHSPVYPMVLKLTALTNTLAFFGKDLARNDEFMRSTFAYIEETIKTAEVVRLLPRVIAPLVGHALARRFSSNETMYYALLPVAEQRLQEKALEKLGQKVEKHHDCIQWILETSPKKNPWSAQRIVYELMAIWFGSVHALSTTITYAIHDLCLHPEYIEPLRMELESAQYAEFERTGQGLPLLDSFIKESARLTPIESMSTRRHALQPFTLSDGTHLNVGDWACTPIQAMMQDPELYPEPLQFKGFRFVESKVLEQAELSAFKFPQGPSKLTDANINGSWHVWGTGRMACPGRYYAAAVMKMMLAQVILHYDCELVDKDAPRWFTWRSSMLPLAKTMVIFRPRQHQSESQL
ncbi:hypothetical protein VTN77DRAFT_563 [Rasamsonia byssochlamydoides]|uniref:uncharacterized protein n=1 Tax=Rasamsonia byssochlamydoides TaxID=89139 RepID=UPI003743DAFA